MGKQRIEFLKESLRNLRLTGSVSPSSRFLCRAIAQKINPDTAKVVVELGPGDGVITQFLLDRLHAGSRLIIFEINPTFIARLQENIQDPRVTIIHDSAEQIGLHLNAMGIEQVDYIVSGIPMVMLPEQLAQRITLSCRNYLKAGGQFIQFHYSPLLLNRYRKVFGNLKIEIVPWNIPPAIVIRCLKLAF